MRWFAGVLDVVTGLLTGYAALLQMMQTVNGGPWSWSYPCMLGASVLLFVAGVHNMRLETKPVRLALIAAAIPVGLCAVLGRTPVRCWVFTATVGLMAWVCFTFAAGSRRPGLAALVANCALIASWLPISAATIYAVTVHSPPMTARALLPLAAFWTFLLATVITSGLFFLRAPQP